MTNRLRRTKLFAPQISDNFTPRPRLIGDLEGSRKTPLILVSGAAGYGKSTTISNWLRQSQQSYCWLSLDEADNDFATFATYVVATLQMVDMVMGQDILRMLESTNSVTVDFVATEIINDIIDAESDIILVLDDYHVIHNQQIHDTLIMLIENQPPTLQIILCTRSDPPFPLARWRVRQYIREIRNSNLRFSGTEIQAFFKQRLEIELSKENLEIVERRSEGWIASLQLIDVALKTRKHTLDAVWLDEYIASFDGTQRFIMDFLIDEVLDQLPDETTRFLLHTAILPRFCAELCDFALNHDDCGSVIQHLIQSNMFLIPLDDDHQRFRYHHLFADLLQKFAYQQGISTGDIYSRASAWFDQNGMLEDAIEMQLKAKNYPHVAQMLNSINNTDLWRDGHWTKLIKWVEAMPDDIVHENAYLFVNYVWSLFATGDRIRGFRALEHLEQSLENVHGAAAAVRGRIAGIKGMIARIGGDVDDMRQLGKIVCDTLAPDDSFWYVSGLINLGAADFLADNSESAFDWFEQAHSLSHKNRLPHWEIVALIHIAELRYRYGELYIAEKLYHQVKDIIDDENYVYTSSEGAVFAGLGQLWYEQNDLQRAELNFQRGLDAGIKVRNGLIIFSCQVGLARINIAENNHELAVEKLQTLEKRIEAPGFNWTWQHIPLEATIAHMWLDVGQTRRAERLIDPIIESLSITTFPRYWYEQIRIAETRVLLARKETDESLELLTILADDAKAVQRINSLISIYLLQVQALDILGEEQLAVETLQRAVAIAEPAEYIRTFVDSGELIHKYLQQLQPDLQYGDYVQQILQAFPQAVQPETKKPQLVEPLTKREQELLELIATGISNRDIAGQLFISYATVRRHLNNIYGKLAVNSRSQAILRAQELNLV